MKIKSILITLFVLTMIISPASAGWVIQIPDIFSDTETHLKIKVDGKKVSDSPLDLMVFGAAENVEYVSSSDAYEVSPGQSISVLASVYNPASSPRGRYYKVAIYTETDMYVTSPQVFLEPNEIHDWYYTIYAPTTPSRQTIYIESATYDPFSETEFRFDDVDTFDLLVASPATPTPTPTPTSTATWPTQTPTATSTAVPTVTPIPNNPPTVNVILTKSGNTLNYDASSSTDSDGSIVTREWSVDGIVMSASNTYSVNMDNLDAGDHVVKFTATDNDGAKGIYDHYFSITVTNDIVVIGDETEQYVEQDSPDTATGEPDETAPFVMNIGGQPYYIPGFTAMFVIAGLLAVAYLLRRVRVE